MIALYKLLKFQIILYEGTFSYLLSFKKRREYLSGSAYDAKFVLVQSKSILHTKEMLISNGMLCNAQQVLHLLGKVLELPTWKNWRWDCCDGWEVTWMWCRLETWLPQSASGCKVSRMPVRRAACRLFQPIFAVSRNAVYNKNSRLCICSCSFFFFQNMLCNTLNFPVRSFCLVI